jgi:hypothetical protein
MEKNNFEPYKTMKKMSEKRKVQTLSQEASYRIDNKIALGLIPIKKEFYRKERNSRAYISEIERKTAEI